MALHLFYHSTGKLRNTTSYSDIMKEKHLNREWEIKHNFECITFFN